MPKADKQPLAPQLLIGLLAVLVFWTVQQIHLPASFGVKGLNSINVLMLMSMAAVFIVRREAAPSPAPPMRGAILLFFVALVWGFAIGQIGDASRTADDLTVLKTGIFYMSLYFVFYYGVREAREIRLLMAVVLFTAALAGVEAVREAFDYGFAVYSESKRASGPFGTDYKASNLAAVFFAIFIPVFVAVALFLSDRPYLRFAALMGAMLLVTALFFTYSRQAYAIVAVIGMLLAFRKNLFVAILLSLALWNYELWVPSSAVERVQETEQVDEYGQVRVDDSTSSRWELWAGAGQMIKERPMGIGLNHFKREVSKYTRYTNLDAHNFYVLITTEAGIFGGIAIAILTLTMLRFALGNLRFATTPESRTLAYALLGATIALLMGNLYGSRFLNGEVVGNYWVLAALVARYFDLQREGRVNQLASLTQKSVEPRLKTRSASGRRLPAPDEAPLPDSPVGAQPVGALRNAPLRPRNQYGRRV